MQLAAHKAPVVERRPISRAQPLATIWLPFPPSTNNLFKNVKRGRVVSEAYARWRKEAGWAVMQQREAKQSISGRVRLVMTLTPPNKVTRDCTNFTKAAEDFLVERGILQGDSWQHVAGCSCDWSQRFLDNQDTSEPGVVIEIYEAT